MVETAEVLQKGRLTGEKMGKRVEGWLEAVPVRQAGEGHLGMRHSRMAQGVGERRRWGAEPGRGKHLGADVQRGQKIFGVTKGRKVRGRWGLPVRGRGWGGSEVAKLRLQCKGRRAAGEGKGGRAAGDGERGRASGANVAVGLAGQQSGTERCIPSWRFEWLVGAAGTLGPKLAAKRRCWQESGGHVCAAKLL